MADLKAYFSLGSCSGGQWLDDDSIVFTRTGPEGKSIVRRNLKTQQEAVLFLTQEGIRGIYVAHKTGDIFFSIDVGGAENLQIFRVARGGTDAVAVTENPAASHQLGGLLPDGRTLAVSSNARVRGTFDIVAIDMQTKEQRMILQNSDNYNMPSGLSPDGRYLLVNKLMGTNNNPLWMVELEQGSAQKTPDNGVTAAYNHPAWKSDSSGFYMVSDEDSEFAYVAWYGIADKSYKKILSFSWDVNDIALSHDDRYLAISVNEAGYGKLYIYDLQHSRFVNTPEPPKGVLSPGSLCWAPGSLKLLFASSGSARPQNIWLLDMEADSLCRAAECHMAGLTADDFCEPTLHTFKSFDGLEVPYFLYAPAGMSKNMPVMIDIHGGPEGQSRPGTANKALLHYMVSLGVAVVEPNVRGSTGYGRTYTHLDDVEKRLDSVKDIEWLVGHLTETGIADSSKIGVMGGSYGGFMTLSCAARLPELWCCAVCTVGMFNLVTFLENTADYRRPHRESEYGSLAEHRDVLFNVSPVAKVDDIKGPLMIIHGENDPRVPVSEAHQACEYLAARGVPVELKIYDDEGHGLAKLKNKLDCYPIVMDFVKKHMKLD